MATKNEKRDLPALALLDLKVALKNTRQQTTFVSLSKIADTIKETFYEDDLKVLSKLLLKK